MRTIILIVFFSCLFLIQIGWTQGEGKVFENITQFEARIENLSFAKDNNPKDSLLRDSVLTGERSAISNFRVSVFSGDLYIRFDIAMEGEEYNIFLEGVENQSTKKVFPLSPKNLYGDIGTLILGEVGRSKEIVIVNNAENSNPLLLSGNIKIQLRVEVINYKTYHSSFWNLPVKCNQPIERWHKKKKRLILPIGFTAAGVGGFFWENDYQPTYNSYKEYQVSGDNTDSVYDEANKIKGNNTNRKNWGIALVAASAAWIGIQHWRNWERKKIFRKECCQENTDCELCEKKRKKEEKKKEKAMKKMEKKGLSFEVFDHNSKLPIPNFSPFGTKVAMGIKYTF